MLTSLYGCSYLHSAARHSSRPRRENEAGTKTVAVRRQATV
jgi:hypothetical protein